MHFLYKRVIGIVNSYVFLRVNKNSSSGSQSPVLGLILRCLGTIFFRSSKYESMAFAHSGLRKEHI